VLTGQRVVGKGSIVSRGVVKSRVGSEKGRFSHVGRERSCGVVKGRLCRVDRERSCGVGKGSIVSCGVVKGCVGS